MRAAPEVVLRADRPSVIEETFDGEAVLVHLETGCYYALNAAGTAVWELVRDGRTPAQVHGLVGAKRGSADADSAGAFVEQLASERLLVADPACDSGEEAPALDPEPWPDAPALQRFDDLQDLLKVDPIHDVRLGADGWPVAAAP
jgi:Coenzyme PQQ synthesis protein D (PqqD)